MGKSLQDRYATTPLFGGNAAAIEALYEQFLDDPDSVVDSWRQYFRSLGDGHAEIAHGPIRKRLQQQSQSSTAGRPRVVSAASSLASANEKQAAVSRMIQVYSLRGHQIADIDPLGLTERPVPGVLKLDYLGLTSADMDTEFSTGGFAGTGDRRMKLRDILELLKKIYCGKIGAEFAQL